MCIIFFSKKNVLKLALRFVASSIEIGDTYYYELRDCCTRTIIESIEDDRVYVRQKNG